MKAWRKMGPGSHYIAPEDVGLERRNGRLTERGSLCGGKQVHLLGVYDLLTC